MRWLLLLLGLTIHLSGGSFDDLTPSSPEEIASLQPDLVVDGFVSALSGQLAITEVDLHVKGAGDLIMKRTYVPPRVFGRYDDKDERDRFFLVDALNRLHTKGWRFWPHLLAGYNRNSPNFLVRDPQGSVLEFKIQGNRGIIQSFYGCSNLKRGEPSSVADIRNIELSIEGKEVKVSYPDGTDHIYVHLAAYIYRLDRELLPNGKAVRYQYNSKGLARISSTDISGKYTYAYLDRINGRHFRGSDGREVNHLYEVRTIKGKFKTKKEKRKAKSTFPLLTRSINPVYSNKAGYNDRTLLTSYDAKAYPISASYYQQKGEIARVETFSTPSSSISFSYDPPIAGKKGGSTKVSYPDGAVVIYRFNSSLLLSGLENWFEGKLYNQKVFTYDHKQHLSKVETKDGEGNTLLTKLYECDKAGNPIIETHVGDFGTFSIRRRFSKNRLIFEERDDGLGFEYTYLGDTRLPLSKTILTNGQVTRRTLYSYDEANNLIEEKEDGKSVTTYQLYQEGQHLHRLQMKEKRDWDGNLVFKIEYFYDQFGNTTKEDHYGSDGKFAYSIERNYDEKGNLIDETNPLGQKASYTYDSRNRAIKEIPFSNSLTIERAFDGKGRLIHFKEGDHETRFSYNASDELIKKIDYLGLTTSYTYHPVHGKPTLIKADPTIEEIAYDAFGREIERKDAYGATKKRKLNSYGDPVEIIYPDGGEETFLYDTNGLLLEEVDPDGLKTSYSYDPFGRMTSKTVGSYETTYLYDAYHLIQEKDPLGISSFYTYNFAGQKIKEERGGITTEFTYDPLGFLSSESRSGRKTTFQNDCLGRVVLKDIDGVLQTEYAYDPAGNIRSITNGNPIYFSYDPYNRLIQKIDEEGNQTNIVYEEGDRTLTKKIIDPKGVQTIETYNAHGLLLQREIPGTFHEEFTYDNALRLISQDHLTFTYTPEGYLSSMCEAGKRTTYWNYTLGGKILSKTKPDGSVISYEYNSQGKLVRMGSRKFGYDALGRMTNGSGFTRELDPFGNIIREELETGVVLQSSYDDWNRPIERVLPDGSKVLYEYEGPFLIKVMRMDPNGLFLYSHSYEKFDRSGNLLLERGFFTTSYDYDKVGRRIYQKSPYFEEALQYDSTGNLIQKGDSNYLYDDASQLTSEEGKFHLAYDQHYNCIQKNGEEIAIDELNQREDVLYDLNGNLIRDGFVYDEFDQLVETGSDHCSYDALGRRLTSGATSYFYIGDEEIGSFEDGRIKELKVLGFMTPIAIEKDQKPFAPVIDVQNTIRQLIDWQRGEAIFQNHCDVFGDGLTGEIPYAYVGKRYDSSTGLIYFGKRFYDPKLGRWLTPDPLGAVDHSNLYQYVFNNPYRFQDPNGESIGGFLLGMGEIALGGTLILTAGVLEVASFGGFTIGVGIQAGAGVAFIEDGLIRATMEAQDISSTSRTRCSNTTGPQEYWSNGFFIVPAPDGCGNLSRVEKNSKDVYAPDRPLPKTKDGIPIPDTNDSHTQLGTKESKRKPGEKYPQAREFDKNGKPVKTIDFTDHNEPLIHPNPHEHNYVPNPTGGTPQRGDPKPLKNWKY